MRRPDQRGLYLNEGEQAEFQVSIKAKGKSAAGAMMRMVKYIPDSVSATANLPPIPTSANQVVNITSGQSAPISIGVNGKSITTMATTVQADANGMVTVKVAAAGSGFPVIVFYPYAAGATPPAPMPAFSEALTSMFTTIRVLPYNDQFVDQFVQLWNSSYDPVKAWDFVYNNVLYLYDMICSRSCSNSCRSATAAGSRRRSIRCWPSWRRATFPKARSPCRSRATCRVARGP